MLCLGVYCREIVDDEELAAGSEPGQGEEEEEEGEGSHEDSAPEIITMPSRFDQVQEKGYIDVWWLYDDGGKTKMPLITNIILACLCIIGVIIVHLTLFFHRFGHSASFLDLP
jgi:hypothetical protein